MLSISPARFGASINTKTIRNSVPHHKMSRRHKDATEHPYDNALWKRAREVGRHLLAKYHAGKKAMESGHRSFSHQDIWQSAHPAQLKLIRQLGKKLHQLLKADKLEPTNATTTALQTFLEII